MSRSFRLIFSLLLINSIVYTSHLTAMQDEEVQKQEASEDSFTEEELGEVAVEMCVICQSGLNDDNNNNNNFTQLHCRHTFHKPCIDGFFKSLLISQENPPLFCVLCREQITQEDVPLFANLQVLPEDILQLYALKLAIWLNQERLTYCTELLADLLEDEDFSKDMQDIFGISEEDFAPIKEKLCELEITVFDIHTGELAAKLSNIFPGINKQDVYEGVCDFIKACNITDQTIDGLILSLGQHPQANMALPFLAPHIRPVKLLLDLIHQNQEINENNKLVLILKDLNMGALVKCLSKHALKYIMTSLNQKLKQGDAHQLFGGYCALMSAYFYTQRERLEPFLRNALEQMGPLELNLERLGDTVDLLRPFFSQERNFDEFAQIVPELLGYHPEIRRSLWRTALLLAENQQEEASEVIYALQPTFKIKLYKRAMTISRDYKTTMAFCAGVFFILILQQLHQVIA